MLGDMSEREIDEQPLNLDVPEHLQYSDEHVWLDDDDDPAILGMTEYGIERLGELEEVELPESGERFEAGDEIAQLNTEHGQTPVITPVAGVVRYVNNAVNDDPGMVSDDPYGEGWLVKIELDDDEPELLDAASYVAVIRR
ncbi:glycine cleavage system H protein [Bifidobacterium tsurumiense]|uniref:Glycine cleavage system H protein n=2 Tax=Bifidobacterium tsurumiense TaxID=356829 RepID=A0A087EK65_9BIFI|nr:glycine cleavage system H protein [Bifidobacterium tsurumiense]